MFRAYGLLKESMIDKELVEEKDGTLVDYTEFQADQVGDEYHTMYELYMHRMALTIALVNIIYLEAPFGITSVMKSKLHYDGTMFEGGYFIIMIDTKYQGQISYHYKLKYWDKFKIPEVERIPFPYDGHTSQDVIERLMNL